MLSKCSLCGKDQSQVDKLIPGVTGFICDECMASAKATLERDGGTDTLSARGDFSADPASSTKSRKVIYVFAALLTVGAVVATAIAIPYLSNKSGSTTGSTTSPPVDSPSQSAGTEAGINAALRPGDTWDIYLAYYVECAFTKDGGLDRNDKEVFCYGGQTIYDFSTNNATEYVVPSWVENEKVRQLVCASSILPTTLIDNEISVVEVDKYAELQIEESGGLLVTASLVSPPTLETKTLNHVPDTENSIVAQIFQQFENYSAGFCIAHYRVSEMPAFTSAVRVYFSEGDIEWILNPDELNSHNFLIQTGRTPDGNYELELWNSNNYSSLVESFNH